MTLDGRGMKFAELECKEDMNLQESDSEEPYSDQTRPPVFTSKQRNYESGTYKPLGQVTYEDDEHVPLLSQSTTALSNTLVPLRQLL